MFFFFKQKTAYEMRISDWSSDVCSSDLDRFGVGRLGIDRRRLDARQRIIEQRGLEPVVTDRQRLLPRFGEGGMLVPPAIAGAHGKTGRPGRQRHVAGRRQRVEEGSARGGGEAALARGAPLQRAVARSEDHTSELQSLMRTSHAVFCLIK